MSKKNDNVSSGAKSEELNGLLLFRSASCWIESIRTSPRTLFSLSREDDNVDPDEWTLEDLCKAIQKFQIMDFVNFSPRQQNQHSSGAQSQSCFYCGEEYPDRSISFIL